VLEDVTSNGTLTSSDGTDITDLINNNADDIVEFKTNNINLF
jgi:hypothetical protein